MTLTRDFATRTRARVVEVRAALAKLRDLGKETGKHLERLSRQQAADQERVASRIGALADDVVDKLPEEATDADRDHAYVLQEQINDLAGGLEEISLASDAVDDLRGLADTINDAYGALREAEAQLKRVEQMAGKLGI